MQPVPPQFVNTGLPEFVRCLALLGRMWRLRFGLNPEQAGRWTVDFQAQLAGARPGGAGVAGELVVGAAGADVGRTAVTLRSVMTGARRALPQAGRPTPVTEPAPCRLCTRSILTGATGRSVALWALSLRSSKMCANRVVCRRGA